MENEQIRIRRLEVNALNKERVREYLMSIDREYPVALTDKVDISAYVTKVFDLGIVIEACCENKTVGMLILYVNDDASKEGCYSLVEVSEKYRRLGVASLLFERSFEIMRQNGMTKAYSYTHKHNAVAIAFHQRMGFAIDANRPNQDQGQYFDDKRTIGTGPLNGTPRLQRTASDEGLRSDTVWLKAMCACMNGEPTKCPRDRTTCWGRAGAQKTAAAESLLEFNICR